MRNLVETYTNLRAKAWFPNLVLTALASYADFSTHELTLEGKAILSARYELIHSLGDGAVAQAIVESIGNYGKSALIMAPFTITSEINKEKYLETQKNEYLIKSKIWGIAGYATTIGANVIMEVLLTPDNHQLWPDLVMGLFAGFQTDQMIRGAFDAARNWQEQKYALPTQAS